MTTGTKNQQLKADFTESPDGENLRHVAVYGSHNRKSKRWELSETEKELKKVLKKGVQHPPKHRFPRYNPFPNVVLGDSNTDIVKIDFDEMPIHKVKRVCNILNKRYGLDGYILLQSSVKLHRIKDVELEENIFKFQTKSYHAVFNRVVSFKELNSIMAWLCMNLKDENLTKWFLMQLQKGTYTLRIGFKGRKNPPRIVFRYGNQDKQIKKFLDNRLFVLKFLEENGNNEQKEI